MNKITRSFCNNTNIEVFLLFSNICIYSSEMEYETAITFFEQFRILDSPNVLLPAPLQ